MIDTVPINSLLINGLKRLLNTLKICKLTWGLFVEHLIVLQLSKVVGELYISGLAKLQLASWFTHLVAYSLRPPLETRRSFLRITAATVEGGGKFQNICQLKPPISDSMRTNM